MAERRPGEKSAAMRIKLKYPDVDTFLQRYGPNLSRTAVFIATKSLKPVGTPLRFEFVLVTEAGDKPVLRGEGVVHQVRDADAVAPGKPQGMSVKYERLFGDGEALVERALALRPRRASMPPPPPPTPASRGATRESTGEVELTSPRDISSGEFQALPPPEAPPDVPPPEPPPDVPPPEPPPDVPSPEPSIEASGLGGDTTRMELPPEEPPRPRAEPHVDVDALAAEWQISTERVDEILRRRRPRDPADADELEALLSAPAPDAVSPAEATARLAQLLDRRRRPR